MRVAFFHSSKNPGVYHLCSKCGDGKHIETKYKASEKGGGKLCKICEQLIAKNRC